MPPSTLSGFVVPMLPTLVDEAPDGDAWVHEIKYDGYRTMLSVNGAETRAFTRNGHDWTESYIDIVEVALDLRCESAIIDGEMCVQNEAGVTDFHALRRSIDRAPGRLVFFAFDLLMLDGRDIRAEPLLDRRRRLQDVLATRPSSRLHFSGHHVGDGPAFFKAADKHGLEGIVSKRADSRYVGARAKTWLKVKSFTTGTYEVVGVERSSTGIPVALLATQGKDPTYVGNAMIALSDKERQAFWSKVEKLGTPRARLSALSKNKKATWIKEGLVARVRHLRGEEKLRHATMQSIGAGESLDDDLGDRHGDE